MLEWQLPGKTRVRNHQLTCVEWHVKPYTLTQQRCLVNTTCATCRPYSVGRPYAANL